ncbi:MAG: HDOD domain-containing protein, partial [Thiohalomonadales bacterium]
MQINVDQLEIPKASASAALALDIVSRDDPDMQQLESAIMHDPVLASTLLRYANSPLMRRSTSVSNVPHALQLLGLNSIKSAIVTATMRSLLPKGSEIGTSILQHMTSISALCKLIAVNICADSSDELEFLGLVHDVGILTLFSNYNESYGEVYTKAKKAGLPLDQIEETEFGFNHGLVSARTAQDFRLPELHIELLNEFHNRAPLLALASEKDRDTCILALAHRLYQESNSSVLEESILEEESHLAGLLALTDTQIGKIKQDYHHVINS